MAPYLDAERDDNDHTSGTTQGSTLLAGTTSALQYLLEKAKDNLPEESLPHIAKVNFSTANTGSPYFPSPLKQTEAISALKAVEAGVASAIADLHDGPKSRHIEVDLERATAFLFSTYLATVGGLNKSDPEVKKLLKSKVYYSSPLGLAANLHRHRPSASTVYPIPKTIRQPLPDQEPGRVLSSSWILRSDESAQHDRLERLSTRLNSLSRLHQGHRRPR
jgi:hypothetical protein